MGHENGGWMNEDQRAAMHSCEKSAPDGFLLSGERQAGELWTCLDCGQIWRHYTDEAEGSGWEAVRANPAPEAVVTRPPTAPTREEVLEGLRTIRDKPAGWVARRAALDRAIAYLEGDTIAESFRAGMAHAASKAYLATDPADFRGRVIERVLRDVAELPDRTSPEDLPDLLAVRDGELREILLAALEAE